MEQVADGNDSGVLVAGRDHLAREPVERLVATLLCFDRTGIFHVVEDDEVGAGLSVAHSTDALFDGADHYLCVEFADDDGRCAPLIAFLVEWS